MSEKKPILDPVAETILELVRAKGPGKSVSTEDAAHEFARQKWEPADPPPGEWRQYLLAVKQQALFLARSGRIAILRKGSPVDLEKPIKGIIRLGMPAKLPKS